MGYGLWAMISKEVMLYEQLLRVSFLLLIYVWYRRICSGNIIFETLECGLINYRMNYVSQTQA